MIYMWDWLTPNYEVYNMQFIATPHACFERECPNLFNHLCIALLSFNYHKTKQKQKILLCFHSQCNKSRCHSSCCRASTKTIRTFIISGGCYLEMKIYISRSSLKGHSHKRTALLNVRLVWNSVLTPIQTLYFYILVSRHSRKRPRTLSGITT